ncbi:restriction endonuclease subunit S [Pseudomonas sp. PWP3-1b2]|uniref:restriction endonuclease subunit S n=1 Tax=Pseudomonas sp. PWP3-1b2 TaxID=2804656 RepID=UPI003CFB9C99
MSNLVALGECTDRCLTWSPASEDPDGEIDYIDLSSVDKDTKRIEGISPIACSDAPSRARQIVKTGDILVSTVRPNLNGVAIVPTELDGATASTGYTVLRPRSNRVDSSYLFHWVKHPKFVGEMVRLATGASYPAVSDKIVRAAMIPLPPLPEQRRIAAILDRADALRAKRREAITKLNHLLQSLFLEMFGDPMTNPKEWPEKPLSEAVNPGTIVTYGIVQAGKEFAGGTPYIRTGDITDGEIIEVGLRRTDPVIAKKFSRSRVEAGDIVMSIRATVGTTALVPKSLDGANLTQGTARIAVGEKIARNFALHHLRSAGTQRWIERQVKGATFREITLGRLRELPMMIPPRNLQDKFDLICQHIIKNALASQSSSAGLEKLFTSLQQRAFEGKL